MFLPKSLVEGLCDFKIYAISVLSFIGSVGAPDKATIKAENHALQCTTAGPYNAIPSNLLGVGSVCGLGPDLVGSQRAHPLSAEVKKKSMRLGNMSSFFLPSMTSHTANAFDIVCQLDRNDTLDEVPQNKKQKVATGYFWTNFINKTLLLGPDLVGIHSISLAARYRVAACSTTLNQGLETILTAPGQSSAPIFAVSCLGEGIF